MSKVKAFITATLLLAAAALAGAPEAWGKSRHGGGFYRGGILLGFARGILGIGGHRRGKVHFARARHRGVHAGRGGRSHAAALRAPRGSRAAFRSAPIASQASTGWSNPARQHDAAARPPYRAAVWPGPLFFPYALDDVFWPTAYDDVFWTYGTADLMAGILEPQLYVPDAGPAPRDRSRPRGGPHPRGAVASPPANAQPCGEPGDLSGLARIEAELGPAAEEKRALLEDLKASEASAAAMLASACPRQVPPTPIERLDAMTQTFNAMLWAVRMVRPSLERFYDGLTDEQKARLLNPSAERRDAASRWLARCRDEPRAFATRPMDDIMRELELEGAQLAASNDLARASEEAANSLRDSCPAEIPLTPTGRLVAIDKRLSALLRALGTIRPALDRFYASLNDEQKARFDRVGESRRAG